MRFVNYLIYSFIIFLFVSCISDNQTIPFPEDETEYARPVVKKLGKPEIFSVKPLVIPLGKDRPDSIKPPGIIKLGKPKVVPFITNKKTLGKPLIVPFKQPDTIYYFSEVSKPALQKQYPGKTLVKVKEPINKRIKPKIIILGQPEKVTCRPAQTADKAITNLKFYNQDHGLVATEINCICYDKNGNLWVGTDGGLCKFDGKEWWIYTVNQGLCLNIVTKLLESREGNLIIGTEGGLNVLDAKRQSIDCYSMAQGLSSNIIVSLLENKEGKIIIGTLGGGINILDAKNQNLKQYGTEQRLSSNLVRALLESNDGNLFIGTQGGGLNILDTKNQSLKHYGTTEGLSNNVVTSLLESPKGSLIIGTYGGGLSILNIKNHNIAHYGVMQGLSSNFVRAILESFYGNLIIATSEGLNILNLKKQSLQHFSKDLGLSSDRVQCLLENREGYILIGTYSGLNILGANTGSHWDQCLTHYSTASGLSSTIVFGLLENREGNLIIGTLEGGLNILDTKKQSVKHLGTDQGLTSNSIWSLLENREGNLVIGTSRDGINILDVKNQSFIQYKTEHGLSNNNVSSLLERRDSNLIIGTLGGGINILDTKKQCLKRLSTAQGLSNNGVWSLLESREGNLIIGTQGGGLNILDAKNQSLKHYGTAHGLSNNVVTSLLESQDGSLIIGTQGGGINILDFESQNLTHYSKAQGLPNDVVQSIKEDSLGNIWLGTGKGLCKLKKKKGEYLVQKIYDKREGLKFMDCNNNSMLLTQKGKLWAGIGDILTEFDPYQYIDTMRPFTYITAISVMDKNEAWFTERRILQNLNLKDTVWSTAQNTFYVNGNLPLDTSYFIKNKIKYSSVTEDIYHLPIGLQLPFSQNHLTFHYTAVCIAPNADRIRYRYIMEGLDDKWSPIIDKSEVDYRNIPPGKYTFKVSARSVNGYWSKPVEFAFMVLPPWYQTYWAYIIYVVNFILIVSAYSYWRQSKLKTFSKLLVKTQEEEKNRISRELHDDLGQQLSYFRINNSLNDEAKQTIDEIIQKVRTISYDLKPIKIHKNSFKELMEQLINGVKSNIYFSYEIEEVNYLSSEQKIHLYRITQEGINNILKHSNANNARVTFSQKGDEFVLEIMDDGVGIETKDKQNSVGLISMQERARLINAKFKIVNLEKGTKLVVSFKNA